MIKKVVDYMVRDGTMWSTSGSYYIYIEEIEEYTGINTDTIKKNINEIIEAMEEREEVSQCDFNSDGSFDIYYYLDYCENATNEEEE